MPFFLPSCLLSLERLEARRAGLFMKTVFDTIGILKFDFWFFHLGRFSFSSHPDPSAVVPSP